MSGVPKLPEIESVRILRLRPGDTIVATIDPGKDLDVGVAESIRDQLRERFPNNEVLLLHGLELAVKPAEGAE